MKVKIEKLDHFGRGIAFVDGKICFINNALPGEIVKIKIVKNTKKYLLGEVVDYYQLSDDRVDVKCRYYDVCGGCSMMHLSFDKENEYKCEKVKEILKKFGNVSEKTIEKVNAIDEYNYRNKITLHGEKGVLGYFENGSNKIFGVEQCLLADDKINDIINKLNKMSVNQDINEAIIRVNNECDEVMVSLKGDIEEYYVLNNFVDTLIVNDEILLGEGKIISSIGNKKYYVSSKSFFQVNKKLTELLYDEVLSEVKLIRPKRVLDLYCGTGTIGIYICDFVEEVIGVDCCYSSIKDAIENKTLNSCNNIEFICDKVENVIDEFNEIDMVIVDPPRSGLDNNTIQNIKRISADVVLYISCDPATLARDLKLLSSDYDIVCVKPYNMFPRTYHIENFVKLKKK